MNDVVTMTRKERDQIAIFEQIKSKKLTQIRASFILKLSLRQIKRRFKRYLKEGPDGLVHKLRGRKSNHNIDKSIKERILAILRNEFVGFGPTFAAEKLWELHRINVSHETLRQLMIKNNLWEPKQKKKSKHYWRERKHCIGELIQVDGSKHIWFGDQYSTLVVFIDDATSKIMYAEFFDEETIESLSKSTRKYVETHGRPIALYVDRGKVFKINTGKTHNITQYHRMLKELGIDLIFAYSPQAKGRVERSFGTHQDRLVKELKLAEINSLEQANEFLHKTYINQHNAKFAVSPKELADLHKSIQNYDLNSIFCIKESRILKEDNTIVYKTHWFRLDKVQPIMLQKKQAIIVLENFDGTIILMANNKRLFFKEITKPAPKKRERNKPSSCGKNYFKHDFLLADFVSHGDISILRKR